MEALGLFEGLQAGACEERAELVLWLLGHGFSIDQICNSFSPMLLPANRLIGDDGTVVSLRQVAQSSGVNPEFLQDLQRAIGLVRVEDPDAAVLSRADAESVVNAARLVDIGIDAAWIVVIVRQLMEGLTGAAVTMRRAALQALLSPGASELELARAFEEFTRKAKPLLVPMMDELLRVALRHSYETEAINAVERASGTVPEARDVAVAFADIVGFTRLGEKMAPADLSLVAVRLADLTRDIVVRPVQFVKTIGDAVMMVCADPLKLMMTVLELVDAAGTHDLPELRVGLAFGRAANRGGDWYGSPVNLASRVTSAAPAGTVRVAESARNAIGDPVGVEWSFAEAVRLRGVQGSVRLYEARRTDAM
ncbi:adenylate cyclase regulatory domain-containing protein (plasmid) [Mycolicibacterium psychrotolerans]|uniref:adenylate/guanylate cyclase domain-containing protein n=1 Tax=Mycolicibacterium psychrotolerans TaxID=216929 RepID=UPI003D671342